MSALYIKTPPNVSDGTRKNLLINLNEVKSIWTLTPSTSGKNEVRFRTGDNHTIEICFPTPEEAMEWFDKISNLVNTEI